MTNEDIVLYVQERPEIYKEFCIKVLFPTLPGNMPAPLSVNALGAERQRVLCDWFRSTDHIIRAQSDCCGGECA